MTRPIAPHWLLLFCLLAVGVPLQAAPVAVTDDSGARVQLSQPAQRVVALTPHLAEVMYAVGAGRRLVGTVQHADFPDAARRVPRFGDALQINLESLLQSQPDLVLGWMSGNPAALLQRIEELGIPVHRSESPSLDTVAGTIEQIGTLLGKSDLAAPVAGSYRRHLLEMRRNHAGAAPVRVFYQVWPRPLMTVNRQHLIGEALQLCGGENVFADVPVSVPQVGLEAVIRAQPQVILYGAPAGSEDSLRSFWQDYTSIPAVRDGYLVTIPADWVSRPGPRLALGVQAICRVLDAVRQRRVL